MNRKIAAARPGAAVAVRDQWRSEKMTLGGVCRLNIKSPAFSLLMRAIYGEQMTFDALIGAWRRQSVIEGFGKHGFSEEECLLIELRSMEETDNGDKTDTDTARR